MFRNVIMYVKNKLSHSAIQSIAESRYSIRPGSRIMWEDYIH